MRWRGCLRQSAVARSWDARASIALEDLHELICATIAEEPPVTLADGGVIRAGVDAELDELRELSRSRAAGAGGD